MTRFAAGVSMFLALTLSACGDGPEADLALNFRATDASTAALQAVQQRLSAELVGTNGTLTVEEVLLIVDEVKLDPVAGACDEGGPRQVDDAAREESDEATLEEEVEVERGCRGFESGPHLVELPLDGTAVQAFREPVTAGTYEALKFEVAPRPERLAEEIAAAGFEAWPEGASMYVTGSFLPVGATEPEPFELFLDGEVKIELVFPEPLVIDETNQGTEVTVDVDPEAWFVEADGSVIDLTRYAVGEVVKFEYKVASGFSGVEVKTELGDD